MKCRDYEAQVQDFLDGKLDDVQSEAFILHVKECERCYEELEIYFSFYRGTGWENDGKLVKSEDYEFDGTAEDLNKMLDTVLQEIEFRKVRKQVKVISAILIGFVMLAAIIILLCEIL